ncbi:hypothetical protein BHE90_006360 [Fusarium euwallaceae]|uniref:RING-type domain-containing protein n=1 Tax=Fusarium euwallaceae TaxID=1147111 RepID=A0A430LTV4_9HYPO|nr:hypothetical protein BHE90_006360 [Fusarium euwallaceae]
MGQSQDKGRPSNALLPEPYSTVKPEIMNESEIHFEGPVDNAPKRSALKSYPSFERPAWQSSHYVDDPEYPDPNECADEENSVSSIYHSSSASKPENSQSKLRRAVAKLNICKLCKLEPHPDLIEPVPREALSCGHFVCDSCLIQRICLVFACPVYEIFCCQSIVIDENLLRRLITDPEARSRWQSYWDLGRSLTWTCPEGHIIPRTYVLRTEYGIMFGEEFIDCGQCSHPPTTYCVFCSRNVVGATRHECAHDLVIMPFIYRLLLKGTFSISWIRCVIDYALRLRHPTIEATKAAYWRSSGPKQKTSTKKNLPSWEFPGSGHYVGPLPDDGRIALQGFIDAVHSRPPPRTQEFQGGQAQKSQAQEMQYRPRVEHSGGNIEASRAYQMRPESHLADESICRYCGSLVPKFNSDGRKIIQW